MITWGCLESADEALIDEIYLRQRGQGVGTKVMRALFEHLRGRIVKMFLETERHNARARTFYARQGFEADDSIWMSITHKPELYRRKLMATPSFT